MATTKPNILIILADDIGVDTLRIDPVTHNVTVQVTAPSGVTVGPRPLPSLTRLVKSGINFTRACAQPVCSPTRASLFTGLHPWQTGVGFPEPTGNSTLADKTPSGDTIRSLAEALKPVGYVSGMFGKWHLGKPAASQKRTPMDWGWARFEGTHEGGFGPVTSLYGYQRGKPMTLATMASAPIRDPALTQAQYDELVNKGKAAQQACRDFLTKECPGFVDSQPDIRHYIWEKTIEDAGTRQTGLAPTARTYMYSTRDQMSSAKAWIKDKGSTPWCVALTLTAPHDPFHVPPKESYTLQFANPAAPTPTEMYVAMVEAMDYYLGAVLWDAPSLEFQAQLKSTVIIFAGDNGTPDSDVDSLTELIDNDDKDKGTRYIGGVHVPLIIADGAALAGGAPFYLKSSTGVSQANTNNANIIHLADLFKTALAIAGAPVTVSGENAATPTYNAAPYLTGSTPAVKRAFNFSQEFPHPDPEVSEKKLATIIDADFKYKLNCVRSKYVDGGAGDLYTYTFSLLKPHDSIPGGMQEQEITNISDLRFVGKVVELYTEMKKHKLDAGSKDPARAPLPFPPLPAGILTAKKVRLKSLKGDYLHRPDGAAGVTTYSTGIGNEWLFEPTETGAIRLKSWKDDYLLRSSQATGVTSGAPGAGYAAWIVEPIFGYGTVRIKSGLKGDYLIRTDQPQGVTTGELGSGGQWLIEPV